MTENQPAKRKLNLKKILSLSLSAILVVLLALYICSNTLGSLPWAIPFGEGEIQVMRKQAAQVLEWYDEMKNVIPTWYHSR